MCWNRVKLKVQSTVERWQYSQYNWSLRKTARSVCHGGFFFLRKLEFSTFAKFDEHFSNYYTCHSRDLPASQLTSQIIALSTCIFASLHFCIVRLYLTILPMPLLQSHLQTIGLCEAGKKAGDVTQNGRCFFGSIYIERMWKNKKDYVIVNRRYEFLRKELSATGWLVRKRLGSEKIRKRLSKKHNWPIRGISGGYSPERRRTFAELRSLEACPLDRVNPVIHSHTLLPGFIAVIAACVGIVSNLPSPRGPSKKREYDSWVINRNTDRYTIGI